MACITHPSDHHFQPNILALRVHWQQCNCDELGLQDYCCSEVFGKYLHTFSSVRDSKTRPDPHEDSYSRAAPQMKWKLCLKTGEDVADIELCSNHFRSWQSWLLFCVHYCPRDSSSESGRPHQQSCPAIQSMQRLSLDGPDGTKYFHRVACGLNGHSHIRSCSRFKR